MATIMPHSVARRSGSALGTSGCTNDGKVMAGQQTNLFVRAPLIRCLGRYGAGRRGVHLAALATLLGIPAEQHPAFFAMTQQQYQVLVHAGETSSVAVVKALQDAVSGRAMVAQIPDRP